MTSALAVALAALVLASCGADDAPTDDAAVAAAPDDDAAGQDDAAQDDADDDGQDGEADEGSGGSGYVHPVSTDLALPTEHCELVAYVHGQRQNGGTTTVGPIGTYYFDGDVDLDSLPYGLLHYENVIAGIEALDDPELATALGHVTTFHASISEIMDSGLQGEELAIALADFHYGTDPTQGGEGGGMTGDFEQAWLAWLDVQGC